MKSALIALLAICLCLPLVGDDVAKKIFEKTKATAEKGDKEAQYYLALMYDIGKGVEEDHREAAKWYHKAAEQGLAQAQYYLGMTCRKGKGVRQDDKEAVKWFRKAAEQGYADAQKNLGVMYGFGAGVLQDYVTAYAWANIAGANGIDEKRFKSEFLEPKMTPEQIAKAQELYKEMVKNNPKLINE